MSENNRGRIVAPGQINVSHTAVDGPSAQPLSALIPTAGGVNLVSIGGLTKRQAIAAQLLVGFLPRRSDDDALPDARYCDAALHLADTLLERDAATRPSQEPSDPEP